MNASERRQVTPHALRAALEALAAGDRETARHRLEPIAHPLQAASPRRSPTLRQQLGVFRRDRYRCRYCGQAVVLLPALQLLSRHFPDLLPCHETWRRSETHPVYSESFASVDHVEPLARGGSGEADNLVTACARCQFQKADWFLEEIGWTLKPIPSEGWDGLEAVFLAALARTPDPPKRLEQWGRALAA